MDGWPTAKIKAKLKHGDRPGAFKTRLKCMHIKLQHSRLATANLLKIIEEKDTDVICIQEPYNIGCKIGGIPRSRTHPLRVKNERPL